MFPGSPTTLPRPHRAPAKDTAADRVLTEIRGHQHAIDTAEAAKLTAVLAWCELHVTSDPDEAATFGDTPVRLGGQGCPWIREYTITELAAGLRLSLPAARSLVADVLELAFRLPKLWARVQAGQVPAWRARRVADQTQPLSVEAASFVDTQVAGFAEKLGLAGVERLVEDAITRFMPELAREQREAAAEGRFFDVDRDQVSFAGTSHLEGELDLADAIDLDETITRLAAELKELGNDQPLDVRRAQAAGELARRQLALDLAPGLDKLDQQGALDQQHGRPRREVVLYVHLSRDAVLSMEGHGDPVLTREELAEWLDIPDHVQLTVRPVIDVGANLVTHGRFASDLQREQVILRDKTCVAPHCTRPARRLDLDHITPWEQPDDTGPPGTRPTRPPGTSTGTTETNNLAPLCRHHHRAKTFTSWTYQQIHPGIFLWETPRGLHYLTCAGTTTDLN